MASARIGMKLLSSCSQKLSHLLQYCRTTDKNASVVWAKSGLAMWLFSTFKLSSHNTAVTRSTHIFIIQCGSILISRVGEKWLVKVADFGMSKDIYEKGHYQQTDRERPLPMRWMALESLREGIYTTQSDVVWMNAINSMIFLFSAQTLRHPYNIGEEMIPTVGGQHELNPVFWPNLSS